LFDISKGGNAPIENEALERVILHTSHRCMPNIILNDEQSRAIIKP
jgi:hypothetical protein